MLKKRENIFYSKRNRNILKTQVGEAYELSIEDFLRKSNPQDCIWRWDIGYVGN